MKGRVRVEMEVKVPASEAWKLYGTLKLAELVRKVLPQFFTQIEVLKGDGGVGTILQISYTQQGKGTSNRNRYKEEFTVVDDEKRMKEAEMMEGGYLDLGFQSYRVRFEMVENEGSKDECITVSTIEYEAKDETAAALVSAQPLLSLMHAAAKHLVENYARS